jgi:hypothetical protein
MELFQRGSKEKRVLKFVESQPSGTKFTSRKVSKVLNMMPYDVGRIAGIFVEEGKLRDSGRNGHGSHLWEVV